MKIPHLLLYFILSAASLCAADEGPVQLQASNEGQNIRIVAKNSDPNLIRWIQVELPSIQNLSPDRPLPLRAVLAPLGSATLVLLSKKDPSQGYSYRSLEEQGFGNPDAVSSTSTLYLLPYVHGSKRRITQGYLGQSTHQGLYALDFDLPEGTTICAARGGIVADVQEDFDSGGVGAAFASKGNRIEIVHDDGSSALYAHLEFHGAFVHLGQHIQAGDPIGLSGATGEASGPHLHFSVQKHNWDGTVSTYPTLFMLGPNESTSPVEGAFYYAWHPGGPPFQRYFASNVDLNALKRRVTAVQGGLVRLRQQKLDNEDFIFADNPGSHPIWASVSLQNNENVSASVALPYCVTVPAASEVFVMAVTMGLSSHYETHMTFVPLP